MKIWVILVCALLAAGLLWLAAGDGLGELVGVGSEGDSPGSDLEDAIALEDRPSLQGLEIDGADPGPDASAPVPPLSGPENVSPEDAPAPPQVRSLLPGAPPPAVAFVLGSTAPGQRFEVAGDGAALPAGWSYVRNSDGDPTTVWMYPKALVRVQVDVRDGPLSPEHVKFELSHPNTRHARKFHVEGEPDGVRARAARESLEILSRPETLDAPFEIQVARLHGLLLLVRARGYRPAWAELPVADDADIVLSLRVTLERAPIVTGRLVDEDGAPLKPYEVWALLRVPAPSDRWDLECLGFGIGPSWSVVGTAPRQAILFQEELTLYEKGRFRYVVGHRGDLLIHATREGFGSAQVEIADLDQGDRDLGDIVMRPMTSRRLKLAFDGEPRDLFQNAYVTFVAPDEHVLFPEFHAKADAEGRVPTDDLVPGRRYKIRCMDALYTLRRIKAEQGEPGEWWLDADFTWEGQDEITVHAVRLD